MKILGIKKIRVNPINQLKRFPLNTKITNNGKPNHKFSNSLYSKNIYRRSQRLEPKPYIEENLVTESDLDECDVNEKENNDHIITVPSIKTMFNQIKNRDPSKLL